MVSGLGCVRRAVCIFVGAAAVLCMIALSAAAMDAGLASIETTPKTQAAGSVVCVELADKDYVDTTCVFDDEDEPYIVGIWPGSSLEIDVRRYPPRA